MDGVKTWVVLARYQLFSNCGEKDGIIRVDDFKQACVMQSDGKVGSKGTASVCLCFDNIIPRVHKNKEYRTEHYTNGDSRWKVT